MNISAISGFNAAKVQSSFKGQEPKPLFKVTDNMKDDEVVGYSTCGPNYAFPITAGQVRKAQADAKRAELEELKRQAALDRANKKSAETPDEYRARKLYSTEWCM